MLLLRNAQKDRKHNSNWLKQKETYWVRWSNNLIPGIVWFSVQRISRDLFLLLKWLLFFLLSLSCQFMSIFHIILTALSVLCITKRWGKETPCWSRSPSVLSILDSSSSAWSRSMCQGGHGTAPSFSFKKQETSWVIQQLRLHIPRQGFQFDPWIRT